MNDMKNGKKEKDKGQHIQVFVRVRPMNDLEKNNKSKNLVEISNDKEVIAHEHQNDKFFKKLKFDHVFGPSSKQIDVYNIVVSPLLEQVLTGYNCTVFAYGQTGTGKTFTMEGETDFSGIVNWQNDSSAGMIPRALSHLIDKLLLLEAQEYNLRVSYLELYNEELFDLLSPNGDGAKIRLYEDASKKGAIIIQGLEEVTVQNKSEVYKILERGSERKRAVATLMNAQSSRSHTVFTITVHMKENTIEGDEVLKTGKLNLVDLAGSENVGRSGAADRKAREAGTINQSLLTLGRVITALTERTPHIPYRESKLTRLLQESLGGRTKTSIIATISPASVNIEETISTLEYVHRAKNIKNRPAVNQRLSKKEFLKQYADEIERLQRDLLATRERTGVYLADENYKELLSLISEQSKDIEAKINHIKAIEKAMKDKERIFNELKFQNIQQTKKLHEIKAKLNDASAALDTTNQRLKLSARERDEQKYLLEKYVNTEQCLLNQGQTLLNVANTATEDSYKLHEKIARKNETERALEAQGERFRNNICEYIRRIQSNVLSYAEKLNESFTSIKNELDTETFFICENMQRTTNQLSTVLPEEHFSDTNNLTNNINESYSNLQNEMQTVAKDRVTTMESEHELLSKRSMQLAECIAEMIDNDISTNLMAIRDGVTEELSGLSETINEIVDSTCEHRLNVYNETCENVRKIQENVKNLREAQRCTEKQQSFVETMANVYSHFNDLKRNEEEHYANVREKCDRLNELSDQFNDQTTDSYNANMEMRSALREQIRQGIEQIENDVLVSTKQSEQVVELITEQGTSLINELKSSVNEDTEVVREYKNKVDSNAIEIQSRMDEDKRKILSLIKDSQVMVADVSKNQAAFMNDKIIESSDATKATSQKLEARMTEFSPWSNKVDEKLQQLKDEIYTFFTQDLQRDVPTGTTPSKREFSYPRQFTATSPHERILQRFRETRELVEGPEYDEDSFMIGDTPLRHLADSTALSDITLTTSPTEDTVVSTSNDSSIYTSTRDSTYSMNSTIMNVTRTLDSSSGSVNSDTASRKEICSEPNGSSC